MKSRLALLSVLVTGLLAGGAGSALAASTGADAAATQYNQTTPENPPLVAPAPQPAAPAPAPAPQSEVLPKVESQPAPEAAPRSEPEAQPAPAVAAQPAQQVEAGVDNGELPFTGFAAVPVLLLGAALLATGFLLRRRSAS